MNDPLAKTQDLNADTLACAAWIARFLKARGVDRVFGLQGGHIQPIWDHVARQGIRIIDVRDEGAAVHMAHAHAEVAGGLGVAMATAGPGVTNTVTAMANASLARVPVLLIGGCTSRPQANMGPLQDIPHVDILRPVTRASRTLRVAEHVIRELDEAVARAMGDAGEPGPVYMEIPTDVLRTHVPPQLVLDEWIAEKPLRRLPPDAAAIAKAVDVFWAAKRPLLITGRGARGAAAQLVRLLDATGALYLDTQESRGIVPGSHRSFVGAVRARAMKESDLVIAIGRKLDYQAGYGSPAVLPNARWIRIGDNAEELRENRRGEVELFAHPGLALAAIIEALPGARSTDAEWAAALRGEHVRRSTKYANELAMSKAGNDGHMHPNRIFAALREVLKPDAITIADGGDILSFARLGLEAPSTYLDAGTFGCLGVGTPYGVAAALVHPDRQVVVISGDGAFGINAMEIDSAKRHGAKVVFIIANNAAWNIERLDQQMNYGGRIVGTTLAWSDYAAMARAFDLHAERVTDPGRLKGALQEAFAKAPALLDVVVTQDALSSDAGKGLGWVPDYQALTAWDDAEKTRRQ